MLVTRVSDLVHKLSERLGHVAIRKVDDRLEEDLFVQRRFKAFSVL